MRLQWLDGLIELSLYQHSGMNWTSFDNIKALHRRNQHRIRRKNTIRKKTKNEPTTDANIPISYNKYKIMKP